MTGQTEFKEFYIKPVTNTTYLVRTTVNTPNLVSLEILKMGTSDLIQIIFSQTPAIQMDNME
jgi:hypothetical protein